MQVAIWLLLRMQWGPCRHLAPTMGEHEKFTAPDWVNFSSFALLVLLSAAPRCHRGSEVRFNSSRVPSVLDGSHADSQREAAQRLCTGKLLTTAGRPSFQDQNVKVWRMASNLVMFHVSTWEPMSPSLVKVYWMLPDLSSTILLLAGFLGKGRGCGTLRRGPWLDARTPRPPAAEQRRV